MAQAYVAGFLFDRRAEQVALVTKLKPSWQAGLRNAIGGKIEPGEAPRDAMVREFEEETGVRFEDWKLGVHLIREGVYEVYFYFGFSDLVFQVRSVEAETIGVYSALDFDRTKVIPNLRWLVPLMLDPNAAKPISVQDIAGN